MKKHIHLLATASALAFGGVTGAGANTLVLGPGFDGNFVATSATTLSPTTGPDAGMSFTAVQQQDKLWNNFSFTAGDTVQFTFSHDSALSEDFHTISVQDTAFSKTGGSVGYTISTISSNAHLIYVSGAVEQTDGEVHVVATLNGGAFGPLDFTVTSPPPTYVGTTTAALTGTSVNVVDTLTPINFSTVTAVTNSFVEVTAPGPMPGAGLGGLLALVGLGLFTRTRGLLAR